MAQRHMKFGLVGRFGGPEPQTMAQRFALVEEAEDLGFCAFWLNEEHFHTEPRLGVSPIVVATAIAARTRRMRVGTAAILLPLHHPISVIEDLGVLDVLSEGRLDVGIARSGSPNYYTGFGVNREEARERFDESVELMLRAWTEDTVTFEGKYFSVPERAITPRPVQKPMPPIYIATYDIAAVEAFARKGLGVLEGGVESKRNVGAKITAFNLAWTASGRDIPPPAPVSRTLYVGETDESAWRDVEPYLRKAYSGRGQRLGDGLPFEIESREIAVVGSPETVLEKLIELHDLYGVHYVNCLLHSFWYVPADLMRASFRRLARDVMPHFSGEPVAELKAEAEAVRS